jgi:hypothetical protein
MSRFPLRPVVLALAALACSNGKAAAGANDTAKPPATEVAGHAVAQPAAAPAPDSLTDAADRGRILGS